MTRKQDLTQGAILPVLVRLALPIMATSVVQMAYSFTDMIWLGRLGSGAVAGTGTAGFYFWLAFGFILISKVGAEIGVAQSTGRKDLETAAVFARNALQLNLAISIIYGAVLLLGKYQLIGFFRLNDALVESYARDYLTIVSLGIIFNFSNPIFSGIFNGSGDSRTPFMINAVGLILNMTLDPFLIFGWGPFPRMEILGAALATVFSQFVVTIIFICSINGRHSPFSSFRFFRRPVWSTIKRIVRLGSPVALQSGLFTIFAMFLARIIAQWGALPIAVQKVGAHIEALSWMTASGFSAALSAFVGQNFGARQWDRIWKGYFTALGAISVVGIANSFLLILLAQPIFSIFIPEPQAIAYGSVYLRILGLSQLFMVWEITTEGAFNGMGRTIPPSVVGIFFNGLRVPLALILSGTALLGLNGVWWSISLTSVCKGIILVGWFLLVLHRHPEINIPSLAFRPPFNFNLRYLRDKRSIDGKI